MINSIKQAMVSKLLELYKDVNIYDEDVPQNFRTPSFLITVIDQDYSKRISNKYKSTLNFDISYFSDMDKTEIKNNCLEVQQNLFRNFDLVGTYRVLEKQANITDNVLHFIFDIKYSEIIEKIEIKMLKQETNLKE